MAKHTKGPWRIDKITGDDIIGPDGILVASVSPPWKQRRPDAERIANARLIARAPRFYRALRRIVAMRAVEDGSVTVDDVIKIAEEALKKLKLKRRSQPLDELDGEE